MNRHIYSQTSKTSEPALNGILQRKCESCGNHTIAGGKCDECEDKNNVLQRKSSGNIENSEAPPIVHEVLRSSGQPLDKSTRAFFEPRFAHNFSRVPVSSTSQQMSHSKLTVGEPGDVYEQEADRVADSIMLSDKNKNKTSSTNAQHDKEQDEKFDLSQVRIHTDIRAAESASAVNALAYAVGNNIVFGAGQFAPGTHKGRRLIAHELTHVMQQTGAKSNNSTQSSIKRMSEPQVLRSLALDSTVKICHRELTTRNIEVSKGGLRVVLLLKKLDTKNPYCQDHKFWVSLTKEDEWLWVNDDISTCESETGNNRSFSIGGLSKGTYFLTVARNFDNPDCCLEGDILIFDEPVRGDSDDCVRDKNPSAMDIVHGALDLAGFIPVLGAIPDTINAGIYALEGDWANAGLSAVAAVPLWGDGVKFGEITGKSAIKITEKAAIKSGKEGIAKGLKEVQAASKAAEQGAEASAKALKTETKAVGEGTGAATKAEKEAAEAAEKAEKEALKKAEKKAAEKALKEKIKKCLEIYATKEALKKAMGDCRKCKNTDTPAERADKIKCLTLEIAARTAYLKEDCDDFLQGSIDRKKRGEDPKRGHEEALAIKIAALAKCATLPTK